MSIGGHVKFWLIGFVMLFFIMAAVVKPEQYYKVVNEDISRIFTAHGREKGEVIVLDANRLFGSIFGETALRKVVSTMHNRVSHEAALFGIEQRGAAFTNGILRTFKLEIYTLMLRMSSASSWLMAMVVLGVAAMVDGVVSRQIKISGYGFTSPAIQARLAHLCIALAGSSSLMFFLPISVPLWWWPVVVVLVTLSVRFITSNIKQVTT
jgi:hypothetical protein